MPFSATLQVLIVSLTVIAGTVNAASNAAIAVGGPKYSAMRPKPNLFARDSTQPQVGDTVGTALDAFATTTDCTVSALGNFTFTNPQFGICYSLVRNGTGLEAVSISTDASYNCADDMTPSLIFYTADFGCASTTTDIDSRFISDTGCTERGGDPFKGFKLGCTMFE